MPISRCGTLCISRPTASKLVCKFKDLLTILQGKDVYLHSIYDYEHQKDNKGLDASHRDGDGSIHLSFVSYNAGAGASRRTVSERSGQHPSAPSDLLYAVPDILQDRAEGS